MARRKKVTTPTMVAADGHGGCCEGAVIGRSGDGEPLLRRERDASDSDLVTVMLVMLGALIDLKKPFFETVPGTVKWKPLFVCRIRLNVSSRAALHAYRTECTL